MSPCPQEAGGLEAALGPLGPSPGPHTPPGALLTSPGEDTGTNCAASQVLLSPPRTLLPAARGAQVPAEADPSPGSGPALALWGVMHGQGEGLRTRLPMHLGDTGAPTTSALPEAPLLDQPRWKSLHLESEVTAFWDTLTGRAPQGRGACPRRTWMLREVSEGGGGCPPVAHL